VRACDDGGVPFSPRDVVLSFMKLRFFSLMERPCVVGEAFILCRHPLLSLWGKWRRPEWVGEWLFIRWFNRLGIVGVFLILSPEFGGGGTFFWQSV